MDLKLLDEMKFNEKYFTNKKVLNTLLKLKEEYGYIDKENMLSVMQNDNDLVNAIIEGQSYEMSAKNIKGYYKQLKHEYYIRKINEQIEELNQKKISYKEYCRRMEVIANDDMDEGNALLVADNLEEEKGVLREYTNIPELDYLLKGIEYGKLSLWSGITNHGKTTLMIQFAKECLKQRKKIFYFSGEQTANEFKNYLYVGMCNKTQLDFIRDEHNPKIYDTKPKKEVREYFDNIYRNQIYIYNNDTKDNTVSHMIKVMNEAYKRGVRIFFIDNFMQLDNSEQLEEQTKIVELFKRFARDKNAIVNLVAHPRKTQFNKSRLTIFDIAGTQNIANKSANICTIMRTDMLNSEYEEVEYALSKSGYCIEKCDGIVEVIKTKGNACKMVGLVYDFDTKTYREAPKLTEAELNYYEAKYNSKKRSLGSR
ncbi:MAG: AAA family ATPase [Clostridia bacterium]|nr:AAA family ATPase [Clostridia bacterium]